MKPVVIEVGETVGIRSVVRPSNFSPAPALIEGLKRTSVFMDHEEISAPMFRKADV